MQRYTKKQYITALIEVYGMSKEEAKANVKAGLRNGLYGVLNAIADCYVNHTVLTD